MEGSKLAALVARALQLLFAVVVLGVSASLAATFGKFLRDCHAEGESGLCNRVVGGIVPAVRYCVFVGAFGVVDALVGLAGAFMDTLPWMVTVALDALASVFYLAGGIKFAVFLAPTDCGESSGQDSLCTRFRADTAFLFLGFIITLALIGVDFFARRRGGKARGAV